MGKRFRSRARRCARVRTAMSTGEAVRTKTIPELIAYAKLIGERSIWCRRATPHLYDQLFKMPLPRLGHPAVALRRRGEASLRHILAFRIEQQSRPRRCRLHCSEYAHDPVRAARHIGAVSDAD